MSSIVFAEQSEEQGQTVSESKTVLKSKIKNRSGYETDDIGTGGRSSVTKQLYLDDIFLPEHLRFPEFDKSLQPYYEWKRGIRQKRNLNEKNSGALVFKLEHSHNYGTSISPDELGAEVGYLGSTGTLYSDFELVLNDFNWAQHFNDGQAEFIFGRLDLNDYMDVVDYANPWTTFQNSNILENHSIAIPDTSFGFNLSNWLNHHWYLKAAISDANGSLDDIAVFEHGAEFFSYAELGWAPSSTERQLKGLHITIWHVDERVSENIPDGEGIAIGGSWSFDKEWIVFGRFGQSTGEASLMRRSTTIGVSHIWKAYFDVFGFAVNYSELVDESLRDQTTMEAFLKIQLANNIAVTPSFQLLINPALNLQEDYIQIVGLRLRITL
jgi:porin